MSTVPYIKKRELEKMSLALLLEVCFVSFNSFIFIAWLWWWWWLWSSKNIVAAAASLLS